MKVYQFKRVIKPLIEKTIKLNRELALRTRLNRDLANNTIVQSNCLKKKLLLE